MGRRKKTLEGILTRAYWGMLLSLSWGLSANFGGEGEKAGRGRLGALSAPWVHEDDGDA